jgi:hypothetical protein
LLLMEIKSVGNMLGLFTTTPYKQGDVVLKIEGEILSVPTITTIQIAPNSHVDVGSPAKFINHSCNANCHVQNKQIIALRMIVVGEEITFDYQKNEDQLAHPFVCKDCGKLIEGKKNGNPMVQVP